MSSDKKKSKKQKKKKNTVPKDVQAINVGISSKSIETSFLPFTGKTYILRVLFCKEATHVINKIVSMEDVELTDIVPSSKEDVQISNVGPFSEEDFQTINVGISLKSRELSTVKLVYYEYYFVKKQLMLSTK